MLPCLKLEDDLAAFEIFWGWVFITEKLTDWGEWNEREKYFQPPNSFLILMETVGFNLNLWSILEPKWVSAELTRPSERDATLVSDSFLKIISAVFDFMGRYATVNESESLQRLSRAGRPNMALSFSACALITSVNLFPKRWKSDRSERISSH